MVPWNPTAEGWRLSLKLQDLGPGPSVRVALAFGASAGVVNSVQSEELIL
jgi:hypothetical protein